MLEALVVRRLFVSRVFLSIYIFANRTLHNRCSDDAPTQHVARVQRDTQQCAAGMDEPQTQEWTLAVILRVGLLFLLAGLAEIGGGWLVWGALRAGKPWWWAACGSAVLVLYGFVPCLQPISDFGRLYAGSPKPWPRTPTLARADACSPSRCMQS